MKTKEGFVLRQLLGEWIIAGEGIERINFNKIISLNATAAYLWQEIVGKEFSTEDLTKLLLDRYEVSVETAAKDAAALVESWIKAGIIE